MIEILVAMFIFALIVPTIYGAYRAALRVTSDAEDGDQAYSIGRGAMNRIIKDLESVCAYKGSYQFKLTRGEDDQSPPMLTFVSSAHLTFSAHDDQEAIASISYYIDRDEEGGYRLMRKDVLLAGGEAEKTTEAFAICERVRTIKLKFYDDKGQELDFWNSDFDIEGQRNKAPSAVLIDLRLLAPGQTGNPDEEGETPDAYRFLTRIKIGAT